MKLFLSAALAILLMPIVIGCSDTNGATDPPTDIIVVTPTVSAASLNAGTSTSIAITVRRPDGFTGAITLTAVNAPNGITATFSPATLASGTNSTTLTLTADGNAPNGSGTVTIRASGTDVQTQSTTITVTVGSASPGSFTMSVSPGFVSVNKGGSTSALISIDRQGGFTGAVALSINGFPGGVFATISPASVSVGFAVVNIQIDNTVLAGSYTATISGQGDNVPSQSTNLTLTVVPAIRQ